MNFPPEIIEEILRHTTPEKNTWFNIFQTSKQIRKLALKNLDLSISNNEAIRFVCKKQYHSYLKEILEINPYVDPACQQNKLIRNACQNGDLEIAKVLLADPRVNPTACLHWCLMYSTDNGHLEIVRELLKHPLIIPDAVDNYAFSSALIHNRDNIANLLIQHPNMNHQQLFQIACYHQNITIMESIYKKFQSKIIIKAAFDYTLRKHGPNVAALCLKFMSKSEVEQVLAEQK